MKKILLTLIFILAGTSAFAVTFKAGEDTIDLYASMRAFAVFNHTEVNSATSVCGGLPGNACSQLVMGLQGNSRAGVRWTRGDFFVHNEWGMDAENTNVTLRFLYGDYKFNGGDSGRIRIGQLPGIVHTSLFYDSKLSADNALQGFGTIADVRRMGINYEIGNFSVAAISMRQDRANVTGLLGGTFIELMPRLEAAYSISDFTVAGTFVTSHTRNNDGERQNLRSVSAGHIMAAANPKIAENARLIVSGFYAVNGGLYGMVTTGTGWNNNEAVNRATLAMPRIKAGTDEFELDNTSTFGAAVAVTVDAFEAGFGFQSTGNEQWVDNKMGMGVYANYKYRKSIFRVTPEIRYLHAGDHIRFKSAGETPVMKDVRGLQVGVQFRFDI